MNTFQIGVIGSMADLGYDDKLKKIANDIGTEIANQNCLLVYGAEKDSDSLPTVAALASRQAGGLTVGITYDNNKQVYNKNAASVIVCTGLVRGGGRELVQALSCDGIIAISGGSGTLNEICVAYQANIPVVVMSNSGGWSDKLKNSFLDNRKRYQFKSARNPKQALEILIKMLQYREQL